MLNLDLALQAKEQSKLVDWLLGSLESSESDNQDLLNYIREHKNDLLGPEEVEAHLIKRTVGFESGMLNHESERVFLDSVNQIADRIKDDKDNAVLLCEKFEGLYYLLDGNHTFEALRKLGVNQFWVIYAEDRIIHEQLHEMKKDVYYGAIVIFLKKDADGTKYLVVENSKTGNVSFLSGAQEGNETLIQTAQREVIEELGLEPRAYSLVPTEVYQNFVFDEKKKERAGSKGSYQVFVADLSNASGIAPTKELKRVWWKTETEVLSSLTFPDVQELFRQVVASGAVKF